MVDVEGLDTLEEVEVVFREGELLHLSAPLHQIRDLLFHLSDCVFSLFLCASLLLFYRSDELVQFPLHRLLQTSEDLNTFCFLSVCLFLTELHVVLDLLNLQASLLDHLLSFSLRLLQLDLLSFTFLFQRNNIVHLVVQHTAERADTRLVGPTEQLQRFIVLQTHPVFQVLHRVSGRCDLRGRVIKTLDDRWPDASALYLAGAAPAFLHAAAARRHGSQLKSDQLAVGPA
ncbi:hypothetical protein EYF80_033770 [Liparis tanakae]|uniref:Uncharacterized protein n=1 Tax=Liparis tanakae TaxID=230148 RepID=A0A4Z2GTW6_9TELE|nr:hypothetical protein EYF80_033770 [Liparis tanakae]